jgi:hypothetical protein
MPCIVDFTLKVGFGSHSLQQNNNIYGKNKTYFFLPHGNTALALAAVLCSFHPVRLPQLGVEGEKRYLHFLPVVVNLGKPPKLARYAGGRRDIWHNLLAAEEYYPTFLRRARDSKLVCHVGKKRCGKQRRDVGRMQKLKLWAT